MKVFHEYLVNVNPEYESAQGFLIDGGAKALPVGGIIAASPPGFPKGERILFQYNAYFEAEYYNGLQFISPDIVYAVDDISLNGWCLFENLAPGYGKIVTAPAFLNPGDEVKFDPRRAHKIESPLFVEGALYAIRFYNLLLYRKKGLYLKSNL